MNRRIFAILILLLSVIGVYADNGINSPYSRYGVGLLSDQSFGINRQMGGLSYGLRKSGFINIKNPASISSVDTLTMLFETGFSLQNVNFKEGSKRINAKNASFDYIAIQFRLHKGLGLSLGFLPFSNVGYAYSKTVVDENKNDETVVSPHTATYYGNGGIYQPYIGLAWKPFSWVSAGVTGSYIYGDITHEVSGSFSDNTTTSRSYSANIKSYKVDFGLQFIANLAPKHTFTLGTTYSLGHDMHVTASQTTSNSGESTTTEIPNGFKLPHTYGAGFFYSYNNQWGFGADYTLEQWKGSTFFGENTGVGTDRSKISIGAEYSPAELSRNLFKMMSYRAGVHYAQPYTEIGSKKGCNEYGISAGVSIPFINKNNNYSHATLHISGQYIHMQPLSAGMITENYLRLNIGITFDESWFMKFRIR